MKFLVRLLLFTLIVFALSLTKPIDKVQAGQNFDELISVAELTVVISEIQVISQHNAFVELYNYGDEPVDISDWQLHYKPASGGEWTNRIGAAQEHLEHIIHPDKFYVLATNAFKNDNPDILVPWRINWPTAPADGHLRIVAPNNPDDPEWIVIDLVGWGDADGVFENTDPAESAGPGQSISRCFAVNNEITNSDNNALDFIINDSPLPGGGIECPDIADDQPGNDEEISSPVVPCEGIIISEVLPNPDGPRNERPREEHAFIELFNPTDDFIDMFGCGLQTSSNNTIFEFTPDYIISPGEYYALYEKDTGIMLPVGVNGSVYLLWLGNDEHEEVDELQYTSPIPQGAAWAWFGENDWAWTYAITPGVANEDVSLRPCPEGQERNPETNRCRNIASEELAPADCGPGRERNPETNRCRNIPGTAELSDCGPGRERNPETNRCRNITPVSQSMADCGPGRERNPETNRCRSIASSASGLAPCPEGQERNPETNRCRRIVVDNDGAIAGVQDIEAITQNLPANWYIAGVAVLLAALFGLWEWRHDLRNLLFRIRKARLEPKL